MIMTPELRPRYWISGLDKAMQANVDAKQVANLPTLDDDNAWSQLQDWIKLPDDDPNMIG